MDKKEYEILKAKFLKLIANVPPPLREEIIVVVGNQTMSWNAANGDIKQDTDKVAEKVMDMAIMHSCISNTFDKEQIKQRFIAYVNQKYRNYALKLLAMIKNIDDEIKKVELMEKMQERNRQIRRLRSIWKKYAYWS